MLSMGPCAVEQPTILSYIKYDLLGLIRLAAYSAGSKKPMRRMDMKRLTVIVVMVLLLAGMAYAKDYEVTKKAGDLTVDVKIDRNPPISGTNNMEIAVKDAGGKAVTDAKVLVEYSMPAMPGMPAMNYKADAELKGDAYKAAMNLSMSGSWNISIKVTRASKTQTAKFTVDAK